jgi:hypothetical protein
MTPRTVGVAVFGLFFAGLFVATGLQKGWMEALGIWAFALGGAFLLTWAIGAVVYESWWPFRNI